MKKQLIISLIWIFSATGSFADIATGNGNGGDFVRQKFIEYGQMALSQLSAQRDLVDQHKLDFQKLSATLTIDRITVVNEDLIDKTGSLVDALYDKETGVLTLKYTSWQQFLSNSANVTTVTFHEMLRMAGYNDDDFVISRHLKIRPVQLVMTQGDLGQQLLLQVKANQYESVLELLNQGAFVNTIMSSEKDVTPLILATKLGPEGERLAHLLIDRGAGINFKTSKAETPLLWAAYSNQISVVQRLLSLGTIVDRSSPLRWAAYNGHKDIVQILISAGADVNAKDKEGMTALMYASRGGHKEIVQMLISAGADVNAKTVYNYTALDFAYSKKHKDIVKLLRSHGAKFGSKWDNIFWP